MKAAVFRGPQPAPVYEDFPEPAPAKGHAVIAVTAAALSQVVKSRAAGTHYSAGEGFPLVPGIDGVGRRDDGARVYFILPTAPYGSMAERTLVPVSHCLAIPNTLDDVTAAAIAIPGMSSWAAFQERARLRRGETVLVNGATGVAGRLAVQIARHFGARKVIATGRDGAALQEVTALGADTAIVLTDDAEALEASFKQEFAEGVDVVIDYLWGKSAEALLVAAAKAAADGVPIRYVEVGSASGQTISLPSAVLRASSITMMGSGMGSIPKERLAAALKGVFKAVVPAQLKIATRTVPLSEVARAWSADEKARIVFTRD